MMDFHACSWPEPRLNAQDTSLAQYFDAMNDEPLQPVFDTLNNGAGAGAGLGCGNADADGAGPRPVIISFSHYLPFQVRAASPVPVRFFTHPPWSRHDVSVLTGQDPWQAVR